MINWGVMDLNELIGANKKQTIPFGKYKGKSVDSVSDSGYLIWLYQNADLDYALQEEIVNVVFRRYKADLDAEYFGNNSGFMGCPDNVEY